MRSSDRLSLRCCGDVISSPPERVVKVLSPMSMPTGAVTAPSGGFSPPCLPLDRRPGDAPENRFRPHRCSLKKLARPEGRPVGEVHCRSGPAMDSGIAAGTRSAEREAQATNPATPASNSFKDDTRMNNEIIFVVADSAEGGGEARALGQSIFTEADSLEELRAMVRDAVACHFGESDRPDVIRLHFVREEVLAA